MRLDGEVDPEAPGRFQREARLIARLEHPHLLPVYDFDAAHNPPYLVMRYLEGCTLKDILGRTEISPAEAAFLLSQIATPLDYAHRQGVVHQDIKPSNVMLDLEGHLFLTDFGIARLVDQADRSAVGLGTPDYMAPEQATRPIDRSTIGLTSTPWGRCSFQLLTGRPPFYDLDTPLEVIRAHVDSPIPAKLRLLTTALPSAIDQVISPWLWPNLPPDRYQNLPDLPDPLSMRSWGRHCYRSRLQNLKHGGSGDPGRTGPEAESNGRPS